MFKKIEVDPPIETILPLKGAHKQIALEYIIRLIEQHDDKVTIQEVIGMYLNNSEHEKLMKEIEKIKKSLQKQKNKISGNADNKTE